MKGLAAVLAAVGAACLASEARAQFADVPGLSDGLAAISREALAQRLKAAADAASVPPAAAAQKPDVSAYATRGMDVSHYQGAIDWTKVPTAGLSFVYVKATEGDDGVDDRFSANWAGASSAGLRRGAYHFYNFCRTGAAQADNFLKTVAPDPAALPPTIDLEKSRDCKTMPSKDAFLKEFTVFLQKLESAYGRKPVLYVNDRIYAQYLDGAAAGYKLWISDPEHASPLMPAGTQWALWQYSFSGRVAGVPAAVDLDVFDGTPQTLASLDKPSAVMLAWAR